VKVKIIDLSQVWWLTPVIPGTQEAEIRRISVSGQHVTILVRPHLNQQASVVPYICNP
jgi:hypothetical protein